MFKKGEYIIHGHNGICQVDAVTHLDMQGTDSKKLYYVLIPLSAVDSRVYSPVDNQKITVRKALTEKEALKLVDEIPDIEQLWVPQDKVREGQYKEAVRSCDCRQWVRIIKALYLRQQERLAQGKKITVMDEKYFHIAEDNLYAELALALGKEKGDMKDFLISRFDEIQPV
ncbi:CarD family transcriptional regulator [Ruminococcus sp. OA3]|uniref:CarD family transcriptional regulator n=1 Tax=Ruminococcus sp. OA3 TaxID=2914164 RepID=UPI001F06695E|nr:CarD family transcriptional regulator [Ruminococcus sp. OA3]MCH1982017.1 CarD family transcriptional regulator [Ruminococcus sp. OA3]